MKKLKCCGCKGYFDKDTLINLNGSNFHSISCASEYGTKKSRKLKTKQIKLEKKSDNKRKREFINNDKPFQLKKTQTLFNKFIRLRDYGDDCISCGKPPKKKNAGHYRSRGSCPELRFNELNCHLQCEYCNTHLSANLSNYRINLIRKIGLVLVEQLEGPHEPKKYTLDDLKALQQHYKQRIQELEDESGR